MSEHRPVHALDFDGVLHSYTSGWMGVDKIPDPPVPGALEFCQAAVERFEVVVHSSRCSDITGLQEVNGIRFFEDTKLYGTITP